MDPNTARTVLRLDPAAPLTPEAVEQSYAREAWERHPSRYPDADGRASAEAWAATLVEARAVLLAETLPPGSTIPPVPGQVHPADPADATAPAVRRRGLPKGAVIGIVAGAVVLLAGLVAGGIGAANLATTALEQSRLAAEQAEAGSGDVDGGAGAAEADEVGDGTDVEPGDGAPDAEASGVERVEAVETYFTFPAALEMYSDGRYMSECGPEYVEGCWESALFVESDCATLEVELGFSNDPDPAAPAEETLTLTESDATAGAPLPVVFGNDGYEFGWIQDVRCTSAPN